MTISINKKIILGFILVSLILMLVPLTAEAQLWDGRHVVTCNEQNQGPCDLCEMVKVASNAYDFIVQTVLILGIIFILIGAIMMILGSTNQKLYDQGRDAIKWALIGVAVAVGSWAIINTVFVTFTSGGVPWGEIDCTKLDFLTP